MFEEDSIAGADGRLAVALRIKRETYAGGGIEEVSLQATGIRVRSNARARECGPWDKRLNASWSSALDEAVERIGGAGAVLG